MAIPLLLTRPARQAEEFHARLAEALPGRFQVIVSPLSETVPESPRIDLGAVQAVLFSSATAVHQFASLTPERHVPALCVGDQTATTAADYGFSAQSAQGDAAALADLAAMSYLEGAGHFLYARGLQTVGDIAGSLMAQDIPVEEVVLYHQGPLPLTPPALAALASSKGVVVPVFSPAAGFRLAEEIAEATNRSAALVIVAISSNAANACSQIKDAHIYTAGHPSGEGILQVLAAL